MTKPAVFMLEPIGYDGALEANGIVFYFCGDKCRENWTIYRRSDSEGPIALGSSPDWADGHQCDECGKPLN